MRHEHHVRARVTEVVLPGRVESEGLELRSRLLEPPPASHVVLRTEATGVSFAEQQMRRGKYDDQPPFPFVPGYDLVGVVEAVGPGADPAMVGRRYAGVIKTGALATRVVVDAGDLTEVPDGLDPVEVETLVVNGITAWQLLHRRAAAQPGQTVLVHGANGGVGSTLVQMARHLGVRVIGTASTRHHEALRALGAEPVDYAAPDFEAQVRALKPDGCDAVFDHVGGPGIATSFRLLAPGGTLVSYGTAATKNDDGASRGPVLRLISRLLLWNVAPNHRHATFYNYWAGRHRKARFQARVRQDLTGVHGLLADGFLIPQIAALGSRSTRQLPRWSSPSRTPSSVR